MVTLVNRAKVSTATTGTGAITLGSASSGYQTFADAGVVNNNVVRYVIEDGTDFEIGSGTYTATGTTLSRTLDESSTGALLNLTGAAVVYVSATAADLAPVLELYAENPVSATAPSATGNNAVAIGDGASATSTSAIALARNSTASGLFSFAFGINAAAIGTNAIAFGSNTDAAERSVAIGGAGAQALQFNTTAIGSNSSSQGSIAPAGGGAGATALGGSYASGTNSFAAAIGSNSSAYGATGSNAIALGQLSRATAANSIAIGDNAISTTANLIALGGTTDTVQISGAFKMPTSDGTAGQVLSTDGAGNLSWITP